MVSPNTEQVTRESHVLRRPTLEQRVLLYEQSMKELEDTLDWVITLAILFVICQALMVVILFGVVMYMPI